MQKHYKKNKDENITRSKIDSTKIDRVPGTQILNGTKKNCKKCQLGVVPIGGNVSWETGSKN